MTSKRTPDKSGVRVLLHVILSEHDGRRRGEHYVGLGDGDGQLDGFVLIYGVPCGLFTRFTLRKPYGLMSSPG